MWRGRKFLLTATCILSGLGLSFSAWAGNVDTYGIGSKATALGGAYAAYADGPFAAYYNPAGLTQMQRPTASMGVMISDPELEAKGFSVDGTSIQSSNFEDDSLSVYPHLGFVMPINEKWSVGLAAYVPYGLQIDWDKNSSGNPFEQPGAYSSHESWYYREVVTPTAAYKINDKWSVGMGVSLGRSESGHKYQSFGLSMKTGTPVNIEGEMEDSFNYSANVGVMYKPIETLTLGLTYRSQANTDFEGELEIQSAHDEINGVLRGYSLKKGIPYQAIENWEYDISMDDVDHPDQVQFGVRYQPHDRISLEADLVWTNWSTVDKQTAEIDDQLDPGLQVLLADKLENGNFVHGRDWEDTRQIRG